MAKVQIELNSSGVRELLRSAEMKNICQGHAEKIQARLGEGFVVTTNAGKNRVNASVATDTIEAMRDNMENDSILKALR